ncbi:hypothetical protein IF1G_01078 [Cordyceps javanica]|uniref:Uncharacterized protein n=1 Tax=Cordyceps javanica TaxID=43265 RepID=A0A545VHD9_9HYPO|nr:hypothetical protein IF1G_01078 [Cordyceps javanica]
MLYEKGIGEASLLFRWHVPGHQKGQEKHNPSTASTLKGNISPSLSLFSHPLVMVDMMYMG